MGKFNAVNFWIGPDGVLYSPRPTEEQKRQIREDHIRWLAEQWEKER